MTSLYSKTIRLCPFLLQKRMNIIVNQNPHNVEDNISVSELLTHFCMEEKKGIAIAVGMRIIPQTEWESTIIKENETINIITASQGG